ncbi:hypothetical protein AB4K20DRAFT_1862719 [Rhizopus microsporus]
MDYCSAQPPRSFRQNALHGFKQLVDLEGLYNLCGRTKASKGFVHCEVHFEVQPLVDFRRLPGRFRQTLEYRVRKANYIVERVIHFKQTDQMIYFRKKKLQFDEFVTRTRALMTNCQFQGFVICTATSARHLRNMYDTEYTDPRGSRLLNLLSIHGFQMRLMTISLQGLNKMIRDIQLMQAPRSDNSMSDIHLDCQCISFITEYYSCSQ